LIAVWSVMTAPPGWTLTVNVKKYSPLSVVTSALTSQDPSLFCVGPRS